MTMADVTGASAEDGRFSFGQLYGLKCSAVGYCEALLYRLQIRRTNLSLYTYIPLSLGWIWHPSSRLCAPGRLRVGLK